MKKALLLFITLCTLGLGYSQSDIIAVGGSLGTKIDFKDFRFIDLNSNQERSIVSKNADIPEQVVAMTYDTKLQQLLFIGMHTPDIYSYDLHSKHYTRLYSAEKAYAPCALAEQFSRMATSSSGISYALNNSSQQLLEIKPTPTGYSIKELGELSADFKLDQYKFYGGDLIANDNEELYLISANRQVVKINPSTLEANYIGEIKGIEKGYTTNGSAVTSDGKVLLSNAKGKGLYLLDFKNLSAQPLKKIVNSAIYDLASPYVLTSQKIATAHEEAIQIFPSKITNREVSIAIPAQLEGKGTVAIFDVAGNMLISQIIEFSTISEVKTLSLSNLKSGNYYVKILDEQGLTLKNQKIILLR